MLNVIRTDMAPFNQKARHGQFNIMMDKEA
jgi:hypothetical protein